MVPAAIFLLSIGLQLAAAVYALLLIRITGRKMAWILISAAMVLMAWRRIVSFISILMSGRKMGIDVPELIALLVSCLMLLGVLRIRDYFRDIALAKAENKKLEDQLRHAQKMEAVGQLAGGVAHDFNNMLMAIMGYSSVLQMKMREDDPLKVNVDNILSSVDKAANLTKGLLAFSRRQITNPRPLDINDNIKKTEELLMRIIGENIELRTALSDKRLTVIADSGQIDQVLINLSTNARDAMPKGGVLKIESDAVEMDESYVKAHGYGSPGSYALVTVSDTGYGMDEKTRGRIFEPFFTTKETGKGTGLGLSIVYGIIKQHNGYINCLSKPGEGTSFNIYLPMIERDS